MNNATPLYIRSERRKAGPAHNTNHRRRRCIGRRLAGFMHQLRERRVCRAAAAYAILTWIMLQLGEIVFPALGLPEWTLTLVVLVAIAGFPVAMILAWVLQWTEDGLVVDVPQTSGKTRPSTFDSALNVVLLLAAVVVSATLVWDNAVQPAQAAAVTAASEQSPAMAIIPFIGENAADNASARTIEQFLRYELVNNQQFPVRLMAGVSRKEAYSPGNANETLNWVIEGSVHAANGQTRLLLHLVELPDRRYANSWSLIADPDSPAAFQDLAKTAVATVTSDLNN